MERHGKFLFKQCMAIALAGSQSKSDLRASQSSKASFTAYSGTQERETRYARCVIGQDLPAETSTGQSRRRGSDHEHQRRLLLGGLPAHQPRGGEEKEAGRAELRMVRFDAELLTESMYAHCPG